MNLKELKQQYDNGVIISKLTWGKLLDAAMVMESALQAVDNTHHAVPCIKALQTVESM